MYASNYNSSNANMMIVLGVVCMLIGFTGGIFYAGGGSAPPASNDDTDSISIGNQQIYTDGTVANEYFTLTGIHLGDIGNPHNSLAKKIFGIESLEVNRFTYILSISDEGAEIFIVQADPGGTPEFTMLANITESGDISGSIDLENTNQITVYIFYGGIHLVSIEGIVDHD